MHLETLAFGASVSDGGHICRSLALRCRCADALSLPDRTDAGATEEAESNIRVLPGGVQRRRAVASGSPSRWGRSVGYRDPAPGVNSRQDHRRTRLVARGAKCCPGSVGERRPAGLSKLLQFGNRKAEGPPGRGAEVQTQKDQSTVVSLDPQWISDPSQRSIGDCQDRRGGSALVTRITERTVVGHHHSRARWASLRDLCRRGAEFPVTDSAIGVDRRYIWRMRRCEHPEIFATQIAQARATAAGDVPPTEGVEEQGQSEAEGSHSARQGGAVSTRPSPQGGPDVGSREPSDLRRGPKHRGNGLQSSVGTCDQRRWLVAVRENSWREVRSIRPVLASGLALVGIQQDLQRLRSRAGRAGTADQSLAVSGVFRSPRPGSQRRQERSRRRAGGEIKRRWSLGKSSHQGGSRR